MKLTIRDIAELEASGRIKTDDETRRRINDNIDANGVYELRRTRILRRPILVWVTPTSPASHQQRP